MSFATVNDVAVTTGRFEFRLQGAWTAEIDVATTDPATVTGAVDIGFGEDKLKGFAVVVGADQGSAVSLRVTGGAGELSTATPPEMYGRPVTRRAAVLDVLQVGGETLSTTIANGVLEPTFPQWTRLASTVGSSLWALVEAMPGLTWRILPDGTVWIGEETWDALDPEGLVIDEEEPANRRIVFAVEGLQVLPGMSWNEQHITTVVYTLTDRSLRAEATYGESRGGIEQYLGTFVQRETEHLEYHGSYTARAVGQNGDGTLELKPYDPRWKGMSAVRVKRGIPGLTDVKIKPGVDVNFGFEDGSPAKPIVTSWAADDVVLKVVWTGQEFCIGSDAAQPVALAHLVKAMAQAMAGVFASHTHPGGLIGGNTGPPSTPMQVQDVAAKKLKGE